LLLDFAKLIQGQDNLVLDLARIRPVIVVSKRPEGGINQRGIILLQIARKKNSVVFF